MRSTYLKMFEDYLIDIKVTRAKGTYNFYENNLLHIGRFMYEKNIDTVYDINRDITVDYLSLLRNSVSNSTINKRVGILKRCFLFYKITDHYIHSVPKFKEKKRSFDMIDDLTLKRIIKYIDAMPEQSGNNLMHKGIIHLFINTGVRLNELYNIEKKNVNIPMSEILLTITKSGYDRTVIFLPKINKLISKLMKCDNNKTKYLLYNKLKDRPINYTDVNWLFTKIKSDLDIKKLHPHMFRHTYATKMLRNGLDIKSVMDLMGHQNMSTTQRYQHSSKEHTKKAYLDNFNY